MPFQVIPLAITDDNTVQVPIYTEGLLQTDSSVQSPTVSHGVRAGPASMQAKWTVSKFVELELGQRLLPKAAQKTKSQGRLSQPTRKILGSRTNRSQRAEDRAKARATEPG